MKRRGQIFSFVLLVVCATAVYGIEKLNDSRMSSYDVQRYDITTEFNFLERAFAGKTIITAQLLRPTLDFIVHASDQTLKIDSVFFSNTRLSFTHLDEILAIRLPSGIRGNTPFSVAIHYHGNSNSRIRYETGGIFIDLVKGLGRVTTSNEPNYAHLWFPCKDVPNDKATALVNIIVPSNLIGISNGMLTSVERSPGKTTYHWETKYPIATYLINVTVGNYKLFNDEYTGLSGKSMKLSFYVFPEDYQRAKYDFQTTSKILKFFASRFGEYPFIDEKFGYVEVSGTHTMENQTICAIEDRMISGTRQYENTFVHEIAHHWWGNMITPDSWIHSWLNEGFATYAEALYQEHINGVRGYRDYMNLLMNVKNGHYAGSVIGQSDTSYWDAFSTRVYNKGGIILHMLRGVMGDEKFFTAMQNYVNNPSLRYKNAVTKDFIDECEKVYGASLQWFFDEWVYAYTATIDRPELEYQWSASPADKGYDVGLSIRQRTSDTLIYKMPMNVTISSDKSSQTFRIVDSLATQAFRFQVSEKPRFVQIDKDNWVFKIATYTGKE